MNADEALRELKARAALIGGCCSIGRVRKRFGKGEVIALWLSTTDREYRWVERSLEIESHEAPSPISLSGGVVIPRLSEWVTDWYKRSSGLFAGVVVDPLWHSEAAIAGIMSIPGGISVIKSEPLQ